MIKEQLEEFTKALDLAKESIDLTEQSINNNLQVLSGTHLANYRLKVKDLVKRAKSLKPVDKQIDIITKTLKKDIENASKGTK